MRRAAKVVTVDGGREGALGGGLSNDESVQPGDEFCGRGWSIGDWLREQLERTQDRLREEAAAEVRTAFADAVAAATARSRELSRG